LILFIDMTLIMVTHDVYLKNFADRVIYMRDGKIAKQEIIPFEMKKKALEDLDNRINEVTFLLIFIKYIKMNLYLLNKILNYNLIYH